MRITSLSPDHPDSLVLLAQYFMELRGRLGAFDVARSTSATADEMTGDRGVFLVAYEESQPLACGGMKYLSPEVFEIKRMFVVTAARRCGYGRRILDALEDMAFAKGACRLVLDTAAPLSEAAALYGSAGFRQIAPYNDNPYAAHWYGKDLK